MNNKQIVKKLEKSEDLKRSPEVLRDFIEMGQNIYLMDNDYEEGKRICEKGRDIALMRTRRNVAFYDDYLLALKYLARYFNSAH